MTNNKINADDPVAPLQDKVKDLNNVMIGVIMVLFLGFITLLISVIGLVFAYQSESAKSYDSYTTELKELSQKIDSSTK